MNWSNRASRIERGGAVRVSCNLAVTAPRHPHSSYLAAARKQRVFVGAVLSSDGAAGHDTLSLR